LRVLVRSDLLHEDVDPRSPERSQYGFVQALIREVAYSTLALKDRRARHLAAARFFESLGDDELAGALAAHYLDAFKASPAGPEADALASQARVTLRGPGDHRPDAVPGPDRYRPWSLRGGDGGGRAGRRSRRAARPPEGGRRSPRREGHRLLLRRAAVGGAGRARGRPDHRPELRAARSR